MENQNEYTNMGSSSYFPKMRQMPSNAAQLHSFITFHPGTMFFEEQIAIICKRRDISVLQLDSLFIFARYCLMYYGVFKSIVFQAINNHICIFAYAPKEFWQMVSAHIFIDHLAENVTDNIFYNCSTVIKAGTDIIKNFKMYFQKYMEPYPDAEQNNKFTTIVMDYLLDNVAKAEDFFREISGVVEPTLQRLFIAGNSIMELCKKSVLTESERDELLKYLESGKDLVPNFDTDGTINGYYEYINDCMEEEMDELFWDIEMSENNKVKSHGNFGGSNWVDRINYFSKLSEATKNSLAKIGMTILGNDNLPYMHNIGICFVEHNFFRNERELSEVLYKILITERETIGYTNKYDTVTLLDYFTMVIIANDITTTYDKMIEDLFVHKRIPYEFPVEIVLRILSRLLNTIIVLYLQNLSTVLIDNTISTNNIRIINIYQHSMDSYFNIFPVGDKFIPASDIPFVQNINITTTANNTNDIVEI